MVVIATLGELRTTQSRALISYKSAGAAMRRVKGLVLATAVLPTLGALVSSARSPEGAVSREHSVRALACQRQAEFEGPHTRSGEHSSNGYVGSDPGYGDYVKITFFVSQPVDHRIIVRQGTSDNSRLVGEFYGTSANSPKTIYFRSPVSGELLFRISRCAGNQWVSDVAQSTAPAEDGSVTTWTAHGDQARFTVAFGAGLRDEYERNAGPGNPSRRAVEDDAMRRFAPEVRLHPDDRYMPASVPWYLARVRMRWHRISIGPLWGDKNILKREVNVQSLVSQNYKGNPSGSGRESTNYFIQIHGGDREATRRGDLGSAEVYAHIRPAPGGSPRFDIQYWFLYPYNADITGPILSPAHEGDWEHITVRLSPDLQRVDSVFFAAHKSNAGWLPAESVSFNDGHPVVYSAKHSHATYPKAGRQERGIWISLPDDHTKDGGPIWRTWERVVRVGEIGAPEPGQEWVNYNGLWGERGFFVLNPFSTHGAPGPAFQSWWYDDNDPP
jgi:hypothetical protein